MRLKVKPRVSVERIFTLDLTEREARALLAVCRSIGGPDGGPRGIFDSQSGGSLLQQLQNADVDDCEYDYSGTVAFGGRRSRG